MITQIKYSDVIYCVLGFIEIDSKIFALVRDTSNIPSSLLYGTYAAGVITLNSNVQEAY